MTRRWKDRGSNRQQNGLTCHEERVLVALYTAPCPPRQVDVTRVTQVSPRTIRRIVGRMTDAIERTSGAYGATDRLALTEVGRCTVEMIAGRGEERAAE
jgi:hypothetical protein